MGSLVDYEKHYRKGREQCGRPYSEIVKFLKSVPAPAKVLDLGCGQGRDALVAAELGHSVLGVDLSPTGIEQMLEDAASANIKLDGVVCDVVDFRTRKRFDVVVLDRVLHCLPEDERLEVLDRAANYARKGGSILIADTPTNATLISKYFRKRARKWAVKFERGQFLFAQKLFSA